MEAVPDTAGSEDREREEDRDEDGGHTRGRDCRRTRSARLNEPDGEERQDRCRPQLGADRKAQQNSRGDRTVPQNRRERKDRERSRPEVEAGQSDRADEQRREAEESDRGRGA